MKMPRSGLSSFEAACRIAPLHGDGWCGQGAALLALGRASEGLQRLRSAPAAAQSACWWGWKGVLEREGGHMAEAVASLNEATTHAPDDANAWHQRGIALEQSGDRREAANSFKRAAELNPHHEEAWTHLGQILLGAGQSNKALRAFERARSINPHFIPARRGYAEALAARGCGAEALEELNALLRRDALSVATWLAKAELEQRLGRFEAALDAYDGAQNAFERRASSDTAPDKIEASGAWWGKARTWRALNRLEAALNTVDEGLKRFAGNAEGLMLRGELLESAGRDAEAWECFRAVARNGNTQAQTLARACYERLQAQGAAPREAWYELPQAWAAPVVGVKDAFTERAGAVADFAGGLLGSVRGLLGSVRARLGHVHEEDALLRAQNDTGGSGERP